MKTLFISIFCIFYWATSYAVENTIFEEVEYDFGTIYTTDKYVEYCFKGINTYSEALVIKDVRLRCGCTEANWTKKPIEPGDSIKVSILYKNWSTGNFYKTAKVITNFGNIELKVKGYCERKKK